MHFFFLLMLTPLTEVQESDRSLCLVKTELPVKMVCIVS